MKEYSLENDLCSTDWILNKVRESDSYAQNLYAALCNMQWCKKELWNVLKEDYWHCSWRHSGNIIARMRNEGDYIDWYCSGMGGLGGMSEEDESHEQWMERTGYVGEGYVTDKIKEDLDRLGWFPVPYPDINRPDK